MTTASGTLSYPDIENIVDRIISIKTQKWSLPGMDSNDIAQEIRLICWQALDKYDPVKEGKGIFYFLAKCVDNGLYNKGRGIYFDNNPPCVRCPDYNKETKECCGSERYLNYQKRMARRRAVDNPAIMSTFIDVDDDDNRYIDLQSPVGSLTGYIDLDSYIRSRLANDKSLLYYYDMIASGDEASVPASIKRKIKKQLEDDDDD